MRKGILDQLVFRAGKVVRANPWTCALTLLGVTLAYGFAKPELFTLNRWPQSSEILIAVIATAALTFVAISLRRQNRNAQRAHSHFKDLIDQANDAIVICDSRTFELLYANSAMQVRLGLSSDEIMTLKLADIFGTDLMSLREMHSQLRHTQSQAALPSQQRCKDGSLLDIELRASTLSMDGREVTAFITRDVSVSKKAESQLIDNQQRLAQIAHHDQLTGLPNRHYLASFLPGAIESAKAAGLMLGVIFLDLDRFKHINDTYGHETGDKLLTVVAARLRQCVRSGDVIIRMGGDEFVVLFLNLRSDEEVMLGAARIIEQLGAPIVVDQRPLQTSASVGISIFPRDGDDMVELLKHSDTAMYQAKERGRNNVQVFSLQMNRRVQHRVAVEVMLRDALRLKQLDVYYQPLVNLSTRKTIGLEALIRWHHPTHGMIPADWFIPVAEETGLVVPIGNFVLHRAVQDMVKWREAGVELAPVSLNVAPIQLQSGEFQTKIAALLKSANLPAHMLQLEMTERGVFDTRPTKSGDQQQDTLAGLRDLGIKIAIDDFGTGYSSLAYLKHWRVDVLKIDKSFVRDVVTDASDLAIVSAIIAIARNLHIEVIAEGIESYQQADILESLGCHHGQGYLFARPMPADKCLGWFAKARSAEHDYGDMLEKFIITGAHRI